MDIFRRPATDFRDNPVLFVELAHAWAAGGQPPSADHERWLRELPRPLIVKPAEAREALWGVLSYPERARALGWLDRAGILEEILPVWSGDYFRQSLRLRAVEEVHLERWADGLCKSAFDWLCVYQDQKFNGQLGGWALTGLATLLLSGDEPPSSWAIRVEKDLKALKATAGEIERIAAAIHEYPLFYEAITSNVPPTRTISPTAIIATLATLFVIPELSEDLYSRGIQYGNSLLLRFAAPEESTPSQRKSAR